MLPERFHKLRKALTLRQHDLTVLMEGVQKPHNMAAILRSCEAIGIHRAHIIPTSGLHFNKPKSAAGVLRWIDLQRHQDQQQAYARLKQQGMRIIAAHPGESALDFRDYDYTQATAIVLGTERTGLSDKAIAQADELIRIPMHGLVRSLNVSVSAALILYEAQRQRQLQGLYDENADIAENEMNTLFEWAWPRVADYCRRHQIAYPELDPHSGQIRDMQAFKAVITD